MTADPITIAWPDDTTCKQVNVGRTRFYRTPQGLCPSVTTILKVLGLSREALIAWSATEERKATIEAAFKVYAHDSMVSAGHPSLVLARTATEWAASVEKEIGPAKQHLKLMTKAAEIGTQVHDMIRWTLALELGLPVSDKPVLSDPALWAFMAWEDWWKGSGLKPVRVEQPIYHPDHRYAGTIDLIAEAADGALELWDWKTAKAIYDEHHLQAAAYLYAAREFAPVKRAFIGRLPKVESDPAFEVVEVGKLESRTLSLDDLKQAFLASFTCWRILCERKAT